MSAETERTESERVRRAAFGVVAVLLVTAALLWLLYQIRHLVFMVFVALFVAVALEPPVHALTKRGWRRGLATGVVFGVVGLAFLVFIVAMAPLLVAQAGQLVNALPGYVEDLKTLLAGWFDLEADDLDTVLSVGDIGDLRGNVGGIAGGLIGFGSTLFSGVFTMVTIFLFAFYMVAERPLLQMTVLSFLPERRQREALRVWEIAVEKMGVYVYSRVILAFIGGTLAAVFLSVMRVPFSVPLGVWVGLLSQFIPVVGTYLAAVLPALAALTVSPTTALWVVVFFIAYQQVENFVISPRITKRTMAIHPAVSIGAIIIGGALLGGVGIILALPVTAIVQATIAATIERHEVVVGDAGYTLQD